jgi:hypothetical protein
LDHSISQEAGIAAGHQQEQRAPNEPPVDQLGGSQENTRPCSESSANGEAKLDVKPEEAVVEQSKVPGVKMKTRTEVGTSSRHPQNRIVRFPKPDHPISAASNQKPPSRTTVPGTALAPHWGPPDLTPSQRRRIQRMRA